ncbi:MAG: DUF4255 domain-containing protein [Myxococcales bacterium]|nr:DUF4255 domain-containing protein [Myxococcales bacterium]
MLQHVTTFFEADINEYLVTRTGSNATRVVANKIATESGQVAFETNTIALSVVNIEEERVLKQHHNEFSYVNGQQVFVPPPLRLNLFVIFAVHHGTYNESLKLLSYVLTYFQHRRSFTPEKNPGLFEGIEKLTVDLQSLNWEQVNQLWGYLGAKYLPSAVYKITLVALQDGDIVEIQPPILQTRIESQVEVTNR